MALPHLPALGETVSDGQFLETFGGKGANQAIAAARAGGEVTFVAALGADRLGDQMLRNFTNDGLETRFCVRAEDVPSGAALVMFDPQGRNYLAVAPGANYALAPHHLALTLFEASDIVVLQMEIPVETTRRALELAHQARKPVIFNFAPVRNRDIALSSTMEILVVNELEAAALLERSALSKEKAPDAARELRAMGPRRIALTLGEGGVVLADENGEKHLPAFSVSPIDTTAAGDTFCGALAVCWAQNGDSYEAARWASAAAALAVSKVGAQPSIPTRAQIEAFLTQEMTQ